MFIFSTLHAFVLCIPGMLTRAQDNETDNQVHVADLLSELTRGLTPNQVKMVTWHVGIKRVAIAWLGFSRALLEAGQARRHPAHFCRYPRDVQECRFVECEVTQPFVDAWQVHQFHGGPLWSWSLWSLTLRPLSGPSQD
jgi:hypothetical protein